MTVRLPYHLYQSYRGEMLVTADDWRRHARSGKCVVAPLDGRLLVRMAEAIEDGLELIAPCSLAEYDGPYPELVRRVELERPEAAIQLTTGDQPYWVTSDALASAIVSCSEEVPFRWLGIGYAVPFCQNDACAAEFESIVRADASAVVWHVAASVFTWAQSGVYTPPILADTLRCWASTMPELDAWCRWQKDADDPYLRFMMSYATRVIDCRGAFHDDAWLARYSRMLLDRVPGGKLLAGKR